MKMKRQKYSLGKLHISKRKKRNPKTTRVRRTKMEVLIDDKREVVVDDDILSEKSQRKIEAFEREMDLRNAKTIWDLP